MRRLGPRCAQPRYQAQYCSGLPPGQVWVVGQQSFGDRSTARLPVDRHTTLHHATPRPPSPGVFVVRPEQANDRKNSRPRSCPILILGRNRNCQRSVSCRPVSKDVMAKNTSGGPVLIYIERTSVWSRWLAPQQAETRKSVLYSNLGESTQSSCRPVIATRPYQPQPQLQAIYPRDQLLWQPSQHRSSTASPTAGCQVVALAKICSLPRARQTIIDAVEAGRPWNFAQLSGGCFTLLTRFA